MHLNDPLDQGQPYAGPLAVGIKFIEQAEDELMVFFIDTDAVVLNKEDIFTRLLPYADFYARFCLIADVIDGVLHQVLQHFCHAPTVAQYFR